MDSKYDEEEGVLLILGFFEAFGENRILEFHRSDFHYKNPAKEAPHIEMHRMSQSFKGKRFNIVIEDDPSRQAPDKKLTDDFKSRITQELEDVSEGLADPKRRIARKVGDVIEKSLEEHVNSEMVIRAKLKNIL